MLISLRDKEKKLVVKDMLDIDFDMSVERDDEQYYVKVNPNYRLDEVFKKEADAEKRMIEIASARNNLETDLINY